jgi:peptidoglycan hydrolase CwlO-like protein
MHLFPPRLKADVTPPVSIKSSAEMFLDWIFTTILASLCVYLTVMVFYFKTLLRKEKLGNAMVKNTLGDAEVVIRKYQVQLQRALGNIDILSDELNKIRGDTKSLRTRNSQYRIESDKLRQRIKELEGKIEALL